MRLTPAAALAQMTAEEAAERETWEEFLITAVITDERQPWRSFLTC